MTSFEGDTKPYLEYAHACLCSILRKVDRDVVVKPWLDAAESLGRTIRNRPRTLDRLLSRHCSKNADLA